MSSRVPTVSVTAGVDLVERLRVALEDEPTVLVAYIFGSRATDGYRASSDVDVAVLLREQGQTAGLRLAARLAEVTAPLRVDLVELDDAPVALAYRVVRDGRLLVCRDEAARIEFWVGTVDRYLDMAPTRRVLLEGTRRRLRDGRFGRS